jgi:hypothetical protein
VQKEELRAAGVNTTPDPKENWPTVQNGLFNNFKEIKVESKEKFVRTASHFPT